ncbi:MAG: ABC transporter ATP-binding protein, partial [Clostridia bacterium]|nr:ABC transporter ATP-binding protein [Clostridia bacterium]
MWQEYYPLLIAGAIIGTFSVIFIVAYALMKNKKEAVGFDRNIPDSEIVKRLLKYAKPYWKNFLLVLLVMLFSISYDIISPILIGDIEGLVKTDFELNDLFIRVAIYASILLVSLIGTYTQAIVLQKTGQKIISNIREDLFKHIESLSHEQLHHIPVGKLVTRVTNDTNGVSMMFTNIIVNLVKNTFVILGVLIAMLCLNYALTLMVLCFVPFIVLFTLIFRKFSRKAYRSVKDNTTDINTFLSENLSGIKITQIFNREERKMEEFNQRNIKLGKSKRKQIFVFGIFRPLVYMLYITSVMFLFYLGGKGVLDEVPFLGQIITSEIIVTFYMYISKFFNPIQNLAEMFNWLQSAFASAEKIFSILDMQPVVVDEEDAIELESVRGEIEFKNVWFAYVEGEWVLKDVSFKIEPKQTVAFVGATGSGKTTILSLICRNYNIQKGQILIDGIDIRKIKISSLRKHFGQMLQDVFLFSGTIRSNIILREEGISDEEIMEACKYVNADKFISKLEKGLDDEILERGNNFSAGQRQLLSFARTIIHKPEIMILDEATANIDTETELLIQNSLEKMMNIGTMLIVAHRLSTIQHADNIIVLSHGEIIEQGTHFELLKNK